MRHKDGKPRPIKMSIWDAFKGVPTPKPRLHGVGLPTCCSHRALTIPQCDCGNMIHLPSAKPSPADAPTPDNNGRKLGENAAKADEARKEGSELTAEEDAKLIEMKVDGKTWKQIVDELKKPKHVVQARWKDIDPAKAGSKPEAKAESSKKYEAKPDENNDIDKPQAKLSKKEKKALVAKAREEEKGKRDAEKNEEVSEKPAQEEAKEETKPEVSSLLSLLARADMSVSQENQRQ